jgi:hypothetical protein
MLKLWCCFRPPGIDPSRALRGNLLPGAMPGPGQCPLTIIKTTARFEAIEPRTIATIATFSGVEFYRP